MAPPNVRHADLFVQLPREARENFRDLWSLDACHGLGQCLKGLPKTRHALSSDPVAPLALDLRDHSSSRGDLVSAAIRDYHEGRTPVGRVGLALNVAAHLQGIHEITH
jgi:hypothetical protein